MIICYDANKWDEEKNPQERALFGGETASPLFTWNGDLLWKTATAAFSFLFYLYVHCLIPMRPHLKRVKWWNIKEKGNHENGQSVISKLRKIDGDSIHNNQPTLYLCVLHVSYKNHAAGAFRNKHKLKNKEVPKSVSSTLLVNDKQIFWLFLLPLPVLPMPFQSSKQHNTFAEYDYNSFSK